MIGLLNIILLKYSAVPMVFRLYLHSMNSRHARTLDEENKESEQVVSRIVWEILDSGKFQYIGGARWLSAVYELMLGLSGLLQDGVGVKNGKVVVGISKLHRDSNFYGKKNSTKAADFVPDSCIDDIFGAHVLCLNFHMMFESNSIN